MTLWTLPPADALVEVNASESRMENAYRSAAYALKKAIIKVLHLKERDIGVVVRKGIASDAPLPNGYRWTAIFYDLAQGGGGAILPIVRPAQDYEEKIRQIVDEAIRLCSNPECCAEDEGNVHPGYTPICRAQWMNQVRADDTENYREAHACKRCIIGHDNRFEDGLDRLDALAVLERIKASPDNDEGAAGNNALLNAAQNQESLAKILDKLIAFPNRNATDVDKAFLSSFREAIGNDAMKSPEEGMDFKCEDKSVKSILCWQNDKVAFFLSAKEADVEVMRQKYGDWEFVVMSNKIDMTALKEKLKEV